MKSFLFSRFSLIAQAALMAPSFAYAALPASPINSLSEAQSKLCYIAGIIYDLSIVFGVVFIILAAYRYMMSGGDSGKVGEARSALIWGIVGIAVAILATGVPNIVYSILNQGTGTAQQACP